MGCFGNPIIVSGSILCNILYCIVELFSLIRGHRHGWPNHVKTSCTVCVIVLSLCSWTNIVGIKASAGTTILMFNIESNCTNLKFTNKLNLACNHSLRTQTNFDPNSNLIGLRSTKSTSSHHYHKFPTKTGKKKLSIIQKISITLINKTKNYENKWFDHYELNK